jgi:polysaccharide deacetylase 2 family uncharacterized protein YibQ
MLPAALFVAAVLCVATLWWLVRAPGGSEPGPPTEEFGVRLTELASRWGAGPEDLLADREIHKVDGVFVRSWTVRLPSADAADGLAADLAAATVEWRGELTRGPADIDERRLLLKLGIEAFDITVETPAVPVPAADTPVPTHTPAPSRPEPPPHARGRLAILLDDGGQSLDLIAAAAALPPEVAMSVLPFLPHSSEAAVEMHRSGHEVWLHLPMEAQGADAGAGAILVAMTQDEIRTAVHSALNSVPHVVGVNNHMGSTATANLRTMTWVMQELKARDVAFIDSRTTVDTVAEQAARAQGVRTTRRHVFLDNERTRAAVRKQLDEAIYRSRMEGAVVAIGHVARVTIEVLEEDLLDIERRGVDLVPPTKLTR